MRTSIRLFAPLLLGSLPATGATPQPGPSPPAVTPRPANAADVARWNDRTTPRRMLETFYFAVSGYDRVPPLIANAIDCLDLSGLAPDVRERDGALLAHQLEAILSRLGIALYGVPDRPDGERFALEEVGGQPISLARQTDGRWRFDAATVSLIGRMRTPAARAQREAQDARARMAEGRTDPATTVRTFAAAAMGRRDFALAAGCLDLRDVPPKLRASEGAEMARKLSFVMQRCAYLFTQEIPCEPDGYRYVWHSNHRGRILLERVRLPEGQDAWLFSRGSLRNLDALVEGFRRVPPDPRYALLGVEIGEEVLASARQASRPPEGVPAGLASPRKALRTFLEAADGLEFDDARAGDLIGCMDLSSLPEDDRPVLGPRLAAKLEAVLRHLGVDLLAVPDTWEADPLVLGRDSEWQVTLARGRDGAWRFDRGTVARVPDLFDRLTPEEKTARERRSSFHSARQTMLTLLRAVDARDLDLAARCLDLSGIPAAARDELGPLLAYKLKYVVDRIGRVVLEEIPDEANGPRYYFHRGQLGRIDLVRQEGEARRGDWQFSRETVARVEGMFRNGVDRPIAPGLDPHKADRVLPSFRLAPALWLRCRLPAWLRSPVAGLDLYQWVGLAVAVAAASAAAWASLRLAERLACRLLRLVRVEVDRVVVAPKLRPLAAQFGLWCLYLQLRMLDLPATAVGATIPVLKVLWIGLIGWTGFRLIDLVMVLYARSERLVDRRNLSDMIVPTAANGLKLLTFLAAISGQVYLVGSGETLTRLLAGLGLVGLAASLAAQDTLKNFFGTLLLIGEHPFRIGDYVLIQGQEGAVESVGFRSTRLRTPEDSLLTIPNSVMASALIDNRGARTCRRYRALVSLAYDTPLGRMEALRDAVRAYAAAHAKVRADKTEVHIAALGESSVDLMVQVYFQVASYSEEMACRDELNRETLRLAGQLGVEIAFPTRTVHFASKTSGGHEVPPPPKLLGRDRLETWLPAGPGTLPGDNSGEWGGPDGS